LAEFPSDTTKRRSRPGKIGYNLCYRRLRGRDADPHLVIGNPGVDIADLLIAIAVGDLQERGTVSGSGIRPGSSQMLAFDARFVPEEDLLGCILWLTNRSLGACGSTSAASSWWMSFMVRTPSIRMKM
jgi:hypothetical protein